MKSSYLLIAAAIFIMGCGKKSLKPEAGAQVSVRAISARLPSEARQAEAAQLDLDVDWLCTEAPPGSAIHVIDASVGRPIATLKAVHGAPRIRMKALAKPIGAMRAFLSQPRPGVALDSRINLPQLAQTLAQWRLPRGTSVVVTGDPLFRAEGSDAAFNMAGGLVPTDGLLFKEPRLSVFSVLGRERALTGQFWHIGYPDASIWLDDSHLQGAARHFSVWLRSQGATLVTLQPSLAAATQAARDGHSTPLMNDEPDPKAEAAMVRIVKAIRKQAREDEARSRPEVTAQLVQEARGANGTPTLDTHGNPLGAQYDLIPDGSLRGQRLLIVTFDHDPDLENSPLPAALRAKGCEVERIRYPLPQAAAWEAALESANQVWILSSRERDHLPRAHLEALVERWRKGALALYLAGDNEPYFQEANAVLKKIAPGAELAGDQPGTQLLRAASNDGPGFIGSSPLFRGINVFFEGVTISELRGGGLTSICRSSHGGVLLAAIDTKHRRRVVIDGGFTRWFTRHWESAGAPRLAANIAGWLADAPAPSLLAR